MGGLCRTVFLVGCLGLSGSGCSTERVSEPSVIPCTGHQDCPSSSMCDNGFCGPDTSRPDAAILDVHIADAAAASLDSNGGAPPDTGQASGADSGGPGPADGGSPSGGDTGQPLAFCGDGQINNGEACDDGNDVDDDGCDRSCRSGGPAPDCTWLSGRDLPTIYCPRTDWPDAQSVCSDWGGHLVTVLDAADNERIHQVISGGRRNAWIGLNDRADEGQWGWDGRDGAYRNWRPDRPENDDPEDDCAELRRDQGDWSDRDCDDDRIPFCER
jgi:cysteine-rich repeat protein